MKTCIRAVIGACAVAAVTSVPVHANDKDKLEGALLGAAILAGASALAHHHKHHRDGQHYDDAEQEAEFERGYNDGLHDGNFDNYKASEAYPRGYDAGVQERTNRLGHNRKQEHAADRHGAPAEVQMACAVEADKWWHVRDGASVPLSSKSTGSGMYEVTLAAGHNRGVCTVTEGGDVKNIMDDN